VRACCAVVTPRNTPLCCIQRVVSGADRQLARARSAGCSTLRQWDLARAVPRHMRDVALVKGDILGLACAAGRVFTAGDDGAIRRASFCRIFPRRCHEESRSRHWCIQATPRCPCEARA